ncbi:unnamed protein product [Moneuplotes crassus]|uniref:Uncharacterized protein n=1 Tax=Euplotes crassus TaxID=5936 RepID=A0AAD1U5N9_EUPCR|nr:unnamed protein product [Moneuplotes crassus]
MICFTILKSSSRLPYRLAAHKNQMKSIKKKCDLRWCKENEAFRVLKESKLTG